MPVQHPAITDPLPRRAALAAPLAALLPVPLPEPAPSPAPPEAAAAPPQG
jgi:hypothetical protein